jgi:hypothetical protein
MIKLINFEVICDICGKKEKCSAELDAYKSVTQGQIIVSEYDDILPEDWRIDFKDRVVCSQEQCIDEAEYDHQEYRQNSMMPFLEHYNAFQYKA